ETFAKILTLEGYEVRMATNAESGLREIESGYHDGVILDLRMPFINGLGLLYRLRAAQTEFQTPVVVVTGDQCLDDSMLDELTRPGLTSGSSRCGSRPSWTSPDRSSKPAPTTPIRLDPAGPACGVE